MRKVESIDDFNKTENFLSSIDSADAVQEIYAKL